jgi:hypothetical protein
MLGMKSVKDEICSGENGDTTYVSPARNVSPARTINEQSVLFDRQGGTTHVDRDLGRSFIHEGIHMTPGERVLQPLYNADPKLFNQMHAGRYNDASTVFYNTAPH